MDINGIISKINYDYATESPKKFEHIWLAGKERLVWIMISKEIKVGYNNSYMIESYLKLKTDEFSGFLNETLETLKSEVGKSSLPCSEKEKLIFKPE